MAFYLAACWESHSGKADHLLFACCLTEVAKGDAGLDRSILPGVQQE